MYVGDHMNSIRVNIGHDNIRNMRMEHETHKKSYETYHKIDVWVHKTSNYPMSDQTRFAIRCINDIINGRRRDRLGRIRIEW